MALTSLVDIFARKIDIYTNTKETLRMRQIGFLLSLSLFISLNIFSADIKDLSSKSEKDNKAMTRGNWFLGGGMRYENASHLFDFKGHYNTATGKKIQPVDDNTTLSTIDPDDNIPLFGGEFRAGREFAIGKRFSLILTLEAFYSLYKDTNSMKPSEEDIDELLSKDKLEITSLGGTAYAAIGAFPFKVLGVVVLPLVEIGFGKGKRDYSRDYYYDNTVDYAEYYSEKYSEDYSFTKAGIGFNVIASTGIYSYFRFYSTQMDYSSTTSKRKEMVPPIGTTTGTQVVTTPTRNTESGNIFTVSIGFGYRF